MDSKVMDLIDEFMESALVRWVQLFESVVPKEADGIRLYSQYMEVNSNSQNSQDHYLRLTNGIFLNEVMRVIDPNPKMEHLYHSQNHDQMLCVQNFSILNRHLRAYYQEDLQQLILMPLPNIAILGQDPLTEAAVEELRRLLLLLLGCAVQCENKETFIQQIQSLDIETQTAIATCIQEVTQDPRMVLPLQWEELGGLDGAELQVLFVSMARQIQELLTQRDTHLERIAVLCRERETPAGTDTAAPGGHIEEVPQGLAVQLADSRAKLRRLKQELEDKGDQLMDYQQEVHATEDQLKKLQKENRSLNSEVRGMRALRDELDCLRERAGRAEQLQTELQSSKHRLRSLDLTRTQLKEQQQLCVALQETRALLEEQLSDARARCSCLRELERDNLLLRQRLMDMEGERDTERQRVDELLEMNMGLEAELRHNHNNICSQGPMRLARHFHQSEDVESDEEPSQMSQSDEMIGLSADLKPLSVEVGEASSLRLLGAEKENAELRRRLENLQAEQEEADSLDVKGELASLEAEHRNTLREFQNVKNENATLKQRLDLLTKKQQHQEEKEEQVEQVAVVEKEEREGKMKRGVLGSESSRGEGEGTGQRVEEDERGADVMTTQREAGVGEEIGHVKKTEGEEEEEAVRPQTRGEAEGQKEKERASKETTNAPSGTEEDLGKGDTMRDQTPPTSSTSSTPKMVETKEEKKEKIEEHPDRPTCSLPGPDVEHLSSQLHDAQEEAERQATLAQDLRTKLGEQSRKAWEAEQRLVLLEAEGQRLRKAAENLGEARRQIEVLQSEGLHMEEELCRLRSQTELQRMQASVIATLESERAALERERETLRGSMDTLRGAQRKGDQLELTIQSLRTELERQGRSLEASRRREEQLEAELRESALEAESLGRGRDQALLEASRLEQEKEACQSDLDSQRKEQRQREREAARLRQQLQSTASALEHSNQRACSLETEHRRVCQELSQSKEICTQLQDLEKELGSRLNSLEKDNMELKEQNTEAQAKMNTLTEEQANEKAHMKELSNEVARLNQELGRMEGELITATDALLRSEKRKGSSEVDAIPLGQTSQGLSLTHTPSEPHAHPHSLQAVSSEQAEEDQSEPSQGCHLSAHLNAGAEKANWPVNGRLIDLERENAAVCAERMVLLSQLSQSQSASSHLREQVDSLHRHSVSLQDTCTQLQTVNTQLQVEQASLSSQHAALLARCSESEARCATLEAEAKVWSREREESLARMEGTRRDHERMTALQQRQEAELEELLEKQRLLKTSNRNLETQHRDLEGRYQELLEGKAQLEEKEKEMMMEREKMDGEIQKQAERERELGRLKEENERLRGQQREGAQAQTELLAQGSVLRGELSAAQLERTRLEGEISTLRENNQSLDLFNVRLNSQYQLLTQLKGNMEEENRHLVEQNQVLSKDNRALLEQSLERRDQHHSQQRECEEKLSELRREKQKLVEKIMDQYRVLEPGVPVLSKAKKSNWIADRMKKLIKPKGGGAGREGRALYYAAGSVENLADSVEDAHSAQPDPRSAPGSPSPLRRVPSQPESDAEAGGGDTGTRVRSSMGRRKLGSRHGWGLGLGRGAGGASQSFSVGDQKTPPRLRLRSTNTGSTVIWEGDNSPLASSPRKDTPSTSQENLTEEGGKEVKPNDEKPTE
ncbi:coiled-coil domain containing 88A isoform X2 [Hypomesus transpacificus]|uniref:coiled-coil domain containing 88A isoform X2 n=1 Tax=Hypomesus transpacificus TaxID=137520 RepID=UPI001F07D3A0|nr:coiled-coil domain containing 88A isoform X2 [Hypomesus transpacificus]